MDEQWKDLVCVIERTVWDEILTGALLVAVHL